MAYQDIESGSRSYPDTGESNVSFRPGSSDTQRVNKFETSLPIRIDIEAALTYLFGCISGVLFLILEQKNDFVRFHAWQSCLVFFPIIILHVAFSWQNIVSWIIFAFDIILIAFLMYKAYTAGNQNLDRFEIPLLGKLASKWVDSE